MTENDLTRLLQSAADGIEAGDPPLDLMVRRGRAARRRQSVLLVAASIVGVATAVGATVAIVGNDQDRTQEIVPLLVDLDGAWTVGSLTRADGHSALPVDDAEPTLTFRSGGFVAETRCSSSTGTVTRGDGGKETLRLQFGDVISAHDDCAIPTTIFDPLSAVRRVAMSGKSVNLLAEDGRIVAQLNPSGSPPSTLRVNCSASGITVSTHEVQTSPSGLSAVLTSSLPDRSYLTFSSVVAGGGGQSGGDRLPVEPERRTLGFGPGALTLGCWDPDTDVEHKTTVQVVDPAGNWRSFAAIKRFGCGPSSGIADWSGDVFKRGYPTAGSAAQAVADEFATLPSNQDGGPMTVRDAGVGYVGARTQTWIVMKGERGYVTLRVTHGKDGFFSASADTPCTAFHD